MIDSVRSRVVFRDDGPAVGRAGVAVAEVIRQLEEGESWDRVGRSLDLSPIEIIAAVAADGLGADDSAGPPLVQGTPRRPRLLRALSEPALVVPEGKSDRAARLGLAAGLLQVHDFWDASHQAAQGADDLGERGCSAYWHGIAHRREPDAGNAAYWFRRVGRHPTFGPLWEAARPLVETSGDQTTLARLVRAGTWDPTALVDLAARSQPGSPQEALARRLQRLEMLVLLASTAEAAGFA